MTEQTNKLIGREFQIQPEDIDASGHLWEAFDHGETEASAGWLVRFCQARGTGWAPFTRQEINDRYHEKFPQQSFHFNRLIEPGPGYVRAERVMLGGGWIVEEDGRCWFTVDFVERCHRSRPRAEELNTHIIGCPTPRGEGECKCAELSKQWGAAIRQYEGQV